MPFKIILSHNPQNSPLICYHTLSLMDTFIRAEKESFTRRICLVTRKHVSGIVKQVPARCAAGCFGQPVPAAVSVRTILKLIPPAYAVSCLDETLRIFLRRRLLYPASLPPPGADTLCPPSLSRPLPGGECVLHVCIRPGN